MKFWDSEASGITKASFGSLYMFIMFALLWFVSGCFFGYDSTLTSIFMNISAFFISIGAVTSLIVVTYI